MTSCFNVCSHDDVNSAGNQVVTKRFGNNQQDELTSNAKDQELFTMLSQGFNRLSLQERQKQQELLHGVDDEIAEDAALVNNALQELDSQLGRIKAGTAYEQAERMDPLHVFCRILRLMFLRGNRFDVKAAADQMIRFFKMKQQIFGTEKLVKKITIGDLDEDDLKCLRSGTMQIAYKDQSNRPILFHVPGLRVYNTLQNELRVRYFIAMKVLESEEAQRRGAIAVAYAVGQYKDNKNGEGFAEIYHLMMALPVFHAALHHCTDEVAQAALTKVVIRLMPATQRARCRMHFGTHLECQYQLSSFGIHSSLLPFVPETNTIDLEPHLQWCRKCFGTDQHLDTKPAALGPIMEPNPHDVLSLVTTMRGNLGNGRLRELVRDSVEEYRTGSYTEKKRIVDGILGEIHGSGGRFLEQEKGSLVWNELPLSKARLKIRQRFRNLNRRRETVSEQARREALIAGTPLANDVIFGKVFHKNSGTELFHNLIKDRSEEYEMANRNSKVVVVDAMIERIQSEGGRFLQPSTYDKARYVELSSTDAIRERISTYFRNHRRALRYKKNNSIP